VELSALDLDLGLAFVTLASPDLPEPQPCRLAYLPFPAGAARPAPKEDNRQLSASPFLL
jgi:hypothetical protein